MTRILEKNLLASLHFQNFASIVFYWPLVFILRRPAGIQVRVNRNRGLYGLVRERILDLSHQGLVQRAVAREMRTSHTFVGNVVRNYDKTNSSLGLLRSTFPDPKINATVLEYIDVQKHMKPSIYGSEIQQRLLLDGLVHPTDLPSVPQINRRLGQDLVMTCKKLTVSPLEAEKPAAVDRQNEYLQTISQIPASRLQYGNMYWLRVRNFMSCGNKNLFVKLISIIFWQRFHLKWNSKTQ